MSDDPYSLQPWFLMTRLWQLMQGVLDEAAPALEALGLLPKTYFLLSALQENPSPTQLSHAMQLPPPTITYLIKQLEAKAFLGRETQPGDLRRCRLVLTPQGQVALSAGEGIINRLFGQRLAALNTAEQQSFHTALDKLLVVPPTPLTLNFNAQR